MPTANPDALAHFRLHSRLVMAILRYKTAASKVAASLGHLGAMDRDSRADWLEELQRELPDLRDPVDRRRWRVKGFESRDRRTANLYTAAVALAVADCPLTQWIINHSAVQPSGKMSRAANARYKGLLSAARMASVPGAREHAKILVPKKKARWLTIRSPRTLTIVLHGRHWKRHETPEPLDVWRARMHFDTRVVRLIRAIQTRCAVGGVVGTELGLTDAVQVGSGLLLHAHVTFEINGTTANDVSRARRIVAEEWRNTLVSCPDGLAMPTIGREPKIVRAMTHARMSKYTLGLCWPYRFATSKVIDAFLRKSQASPSQLAAIFANLSYPFPPRFRWFGMWDHRGRAHIIDAPRANRNTH